MALQITDDETCQQAAELAKLTGTTPTEAIAAAVRERLEREQKSHRDDSPEARAARKAAWDRFFTKMHTRRRYGISREEVLAWRREGLRH